MEICRHNKRHDALLKKQSLSKEEKRQVICDFEGEMKSKKHSHCKCCRRIRIKQDISKGICATCKKFKDPDYYLKNDALPVWYENGDRSNAPNFHLPAELKNLTLSEKMLIQRVSPFLALQHIKNGVMGLKGHVCAFEQDVNSLATILPRPLNDVNVIRVEQLVRSEIGSEIFKRKAFKVRRSKVITALYWLKQHNPEYFDIEIDETKLEWIGKSDCGYIDVKVIVVEDGDPKKDTLNEDNGPNRDADIETEENNLPCTGYVDNGGMGPLSEIDSEINSELREAVDQSSNRGNINVSWPSIGQRAVNEYSDLKIFVRAFPWLFPGGLGDAKLHPQSLGDWGSLMLFYEDARFASDSIFPFFALNYIIRHRNSTSGGFFIDKFHQYCPDTLEELKQKIQEGDTSFINSLTYYNKRVIGSNSYWNQKRSEVYSWINHHIEVGNGAPTFFITLSCAEYYWPDIAHHLKDRLDLAGIDSSQCYVGAPGFSKIVNDHAIVVQEYFQCRVVEWLDTVGKTIFGIKHYWIRYEFTPGRGQIHAHLLAIADDQEIYKLAHDVSRQADAVPDHTRGSIFADWAAKKIGLTASVKDGFDDLELEKENMPTCLRFMDLEKKEEIYSQDIQNLLKAVQFHNCSGFCMKTSKSGG